MSDEESFVILGSSPTSSLENDGMETVNQSANSSLQSDTPGSLFTSLKSSQLGDLKLAQEAATQTKNYHDIQPEMACPEAKVDLNPQSIQINFQKWLSGDKSEENATSKLWSRPPQLQVENSMTYGLENCALKSPLELQKQKTKERLEQNMTTSLNHEENEKKAYSESAINTTPPSSISSNLAASFIMGEVNSDILKTSVYSQFPSISVEACAEDVVKLQNMVTEYAELKTTIKRANYTMKQFYKNSLQWKEKMNTIEEQYKQQLDNCQKEIQELRNQNKELESSFKQQIEALEIVRKKDREENIKEISEKNALLENMRAQIIKLEEQQLSSFEFVPQSQGDQQNNHCNKDHMTHLEHELKIKELQRKLSEMLASNLDLKDIEKQYIDELNCLKVNLTAAEELIKKNRVEIDELTVLNMERQQQIQTLENSMKSLQIKYEEQKERIILLETQNEVHRADFQMEKESREVAFKEKQQMLQDLRSLQKRNQELIEEHQKIANGIQKKISAASIESTQITAASAAAQTYFNNPQRPIRELPSRSTASPPVSLHMCPICNKAFKSLNILLSHVNDCVDKN